jgi:hypothetical protein
VAEQGWDEKLERFWKAILLDAPYVPAQGYYPEAKE